MIDNQVRVWGLKNSFMLKEAYFSKRGIFMVENILKMTCKEQVTHSYPTVVDLPSGLCPMANVFPILPPKILKSHNSQKYFRLHYHLLLKAHLPHYE